MSFNYYYTKDILVGFRRVGQSRKNIQNVSQDWLKKNHVTCEVHHHNHFKREFLLLFFLQLLAQDNDTCARPSIPLMDICPPFLFLAVAVVLLLHHSQEPLQSPLLAADFIMRCEMNGFSLSLALTFPVAQTACSLDIYLIGNKVNCKYERLIWFLSVVFTDLSCCAGCYQTTLYQVHSRYSTTTFHGLFRNLLVTIDTYVCMYSVVLVSILRQQICVSTE